MPNKQYKSLVEAVQLVEGRRSVESPSLSTPNNQRGLGGIYRMLPLLGETGVPIA